MLIDTVGMSTLFLPDLQYHFHDLDPNAVVTHAYNLASYILQNDNPIEDGETVMIYQVVVLSQNSSMEVPI